MNKVTKITQDTVLPIGLVIVLFTAFGRLTWSTWQWAAHIDEVSAAVAIGLADHKVDDERDKRSYLDELKNQRTILSNIDRRLSVIEGELKRMK